MTTQPVGAESATFTLTLPLADLHNSNQRSHWAPIAKKRKQLRQRAAIECRRLPVFLGPVALDVVFAFPDKRARDVDNYEIKGAIDGIVDARVIEDDSTEYLVSVRRRASPSKAPKDCVTLTFTLTSQAHRF